MHIGKVSEIAYKRSVKKKLSSDLEGVTPGVNGDIDEIINNCIAADQAAKLANVND